MSPRSGDNAEPPLAPPNSLLRLESRAVGSRPITRFPLKFGLVAAVLAVLLFGIWMAVKTTTDRLLYQEATSTAQNWANFLAESVHDLKEIASGEQPESRSMTFFQWAKNAGQVFRYEVFNRDGYSQLIADHHKIILVNISDFSNDAALAAASGAPIVNVREGSSGMPAFFAEAYVPVLVSGEPIAVVAAYVDQTAQRNRFQQTFVLSAVSLCLMTGLAVSIPLGAWYRRTREKQRADAELQFLAHHDALTGLANRAFFSEQIEQRLTRLERGGDPFSIFVLDLDHFKTVNDSLGHPVGDALLKAVAQRLTAAVRPGDTVARLGGDEFAILQSEHGDQRDCAVALARRLVAAIGAPYDIDGQQVIVGTSIGVALAPDHGALSDQLFKSADLALYSAKAKGRSGFELFAPAMEQEARSRHAIAADLHGAVAGREMEVHYQLFVDALSREVRGVEALARWRHPRHGMVRPDLFIPIAEDTGLIVPLGEWILREACRTATQWPADIKVAVNLSAMQFGKGNVVDMVAGVLAGTGLPAERLELEITESVLLRNSADNLSILHRLKRLGLSVVLDDFGTGYSSLSYLRMFPFDKVKIDRSFVAEISTRADCAAIICAITGLTRTLNIEATAEGVETEDQFELLRAAGCNLLQGYLFGRPCRADQIDPTRPPAWPRPDTRATATSAAALTRDLGTA